VLQVRQVELSLHVKQAEGHVWHWKLLSAYVPEGQASTHVLPLRYF